MKTFYFLHHLTNFYQPTTEAEVTATGLEPRTI